MSDEARRAQDRERQRRKREKDRARMETLKDLCEYLLWRDLETAGRLMRDSRFPVEAFPELQHELMRRDTGA